MANKFSGSEIAELGVQIEINGRDFYDELTKRTKIKEAKEVFKHLRDEEEKHIVKFRQILDSFHKYKPKEAYPEEYFEYMNSLANGHVFTEKNKGKEIAKSAKSELKAVNLGIGFEEDSIAYYDGMRKIVSKEDLKIVDELIRQEQKHLRQLMELKKSL